MLATLTKKCWNTFEKCWRNNIGNISEKYWWKILQTVQKIINKKKSKCVGFLGLQYVRWAVLGFVGFIVRLLIHLPVSR
jgi:hypothetical protein